MTKKIIILIAVIAAIVIVAIIITQRSTTKSSSVTIPSGWVTYTSQTMHLSIGHPSNWYVDASEEKTGLLTIQTAPPDINRVKDIGLFRVDMAESNPQGLDPQTWFTQNLAPNIDPPLSKEYIVVGKLPALSLTSDEMGTPRHVYVFAGKKIVGIYYSTEQPTFATTYTNMVNSLHIIDE